MVPFDIVSETPRYDHQTFDQFNERRDVFWSQSIHTLSRKELWGRRAEIPNAFVNDKYSHCLTFYELFLLQNISKITIALEGGGIKCQSHCEACTNSVMAMPALEMVEQYPWIDGENCIRLPYREGGEGSWLKPEGRGIIDVDAAIKRLKKELANPKGLYQVYCNGLANAENYRMPNYYRNHISERIVEHV